MLGDQSALCDDKPQLNMHIVPVMLVLNHLLLFLLKLVG